MTLTPELAAWRKSTRASLLERRMAASVADRHAWSVAITRSLETAFAGLRGLVVGFCWPFKAEYDPRHFVHSLRLRGTRAALPVVVRRHAALEFHEWWPGAPMSSGALDIPAPDGTPLLVPQAMLIPPVGFGGAGERLGYGGGYFDRTLAAIEPAPLKIAVAFELSRIPTAYPQPHDVPMDFIVTEAGIEEVVDRHLIRIAASDCAGRVAALLHARGIRDSDLSK